MFDDRIVDAPFRREDLPSDFEINLFGFRFENGDLIIKQGKARNESAIYGALFLSAIGFFLLFIFIHEWIDTGFHLLMIFYFIIALVPIIAGSVLIFKAYFQNKVLDFNPEFLSISSTLGEKKTFSKEQFRSVFVKEIVTISQYGESNTSFTVNLKFNVSLNMKGDFYLFSVEIPHEMLISSFTEPENIVQAEKDALQIGKIISDYWELPFSAE